MAAIKISSKVDEEVWSELKELAEETHQSISGLLTEAIEDYVRRHRVRPAVLCHLEDSMNENEELGRLFPGLPALAGPPNLLLLAVEAHGASLPTA